MKPKKTENLNCKFVVICVISVVEIVTCISKFYISYFKDANAVSKKTKNYQVSQISHHQIKQSCVLLLSFPSVWLFPDANNYSYDFFIQRLLQTCKKVHIIQTTLCKTPFCRLKKYLLEIQATEMWLKNSTT